MNPRRMIPVGALLASGIALAACGAYTTDVKEVMTKVAPSSENSSGPVAPVQSSPTAQAPPPLPPN